MLPACRKPSEVVSQETRGPGPASLRLNLLHHPLLKDGKGDEQAPLPSELLSCFFSTNCRWKNSEAWWGAGVRKGVPGH